MKTQTIVNDPAEFTPRERELMDRISELMQEKERPALIGREGVRIDLPNPVFHHLVNVVRLMREGKPIVLLPDTECVTTQAAAEVLGVSRPFLVELLNQGAIPHHKVGTHRRIYLKDLTTYIAKRDGERRKGLSELFDAVDEAGVYDNA
jgi:excisionase family DNA binding protein